ncbi:MAG: hypothetical protein JW384_02510 [Nitrosomonadaceae bacterium]|nr:hypothetical protein [Nitrosomonadaceae bacterium]
MYGISNLAAFKFARNHGCENNRSGEPDDELSTNSVIDRYAASAKGSPTAMPSSAPNPVRGNDILQKSQAADVISALSITPSETLLKVAARYFRKEVASFAEVDWRWINHEVLLTPIFWVVMFYTSPISSDQLQQTETLLPGPLIRDLKEILESRFPSISREQVNVFIRNWRAALSAVVSDLATSSQGAQMFVDRMKP